MERRPAIAVAAPNVLMGVGLKAILEKIIPAGRRGAFRRLRILRGGGPRNGSSTSSWRRSCSSRTVQFLPRRGASKTILLCSGQPQPAYADMHCIDVCTSEEADRPRHPAHAPRRAPATNTIVRRRGCAPQAAPLSGREAEVLALIARGYMNKEIADRLQIGLTTVISHRRNIMEKLGIRSVAGLAIYAMTAGYVAGDEL